MQVLRLALILLYILWAGQSALASDDVKCDAQKLTQAVTETGTQLKKIQTENAKAFQIKLQTLKKKKGWSDKEFVANASSFIKNPKTSEFDSKYNTLLASIPKLGSANGTSPVKPDCKILTQLQSHLTELKTVANQKWQYMLGQVDEALKE